MAKSKICTKCKKLQPLTEFHRNKTTNDGLQYWCKECTNIVRAINLKKQQTLVGKDAYNLSQRRFAWERKGINISIDEYNRKFLSQKGCCVVCDKHQSEFKYALAVDHNHETGQVRGLVCTACNVVIGHVENQSGLTGRVKIYLTFWAKKPISVSK